MCEWPLTRERIAGRAAYIQVNRDYPGSGTLRIIRIMGTAADPPAWRGERFRTR